MNQELRDLYQDVILDHSRRPRNFRALGDSARKVEGYNPLCGDKLTVYMDIEDDVVKDVTFQGSGCAISTASASVMTEVLRGKSRREAEELFEAFHGLVTGKESAADNQSLGKLAVFGGVGEFPSRVKCAVLAWHTAKAALEGKEDSISTE